MCIVWLQDFKAKERLFSNFSVKFMSAKFGAVNF